MSARTLLNKTPSKTPRKRRAPSEDDEDVSHKNKRVKVQHRSHGKEAGRVLVLGQGDAGQLGLHDDQGEVIKPSLVPLPEGIVQVAAGGMHTVCLSEPGSVYTFGCNDEGALGRHTSDDDAPETVPGKVLLEQKVVQVSAGDSHTAALTEDGTVYLWGNFRGANGAIGLLEPMKKCDLPVQVPLKEPVVKISSGVDHLVMVTQDGNLYTAGCGEQGQLGRVKVKDMFTNGKGRQSLNRLQTPQPVKFRGKNVHIVDAFCGDYITFAISKEGHVYGFGLSNYHQLGTQGMKTCYFPVKLACFKNNSTTSWVDFSGGQHHTLCLDASGQVYSLGRADDGRLGLGLGVKEKKSVVSPTSVAGMEQASGVCCGDSVSFAVTREGSVYAWGFGENHQLGTGSNEDEWTPVKMTGPQLDSLTVLAASSGGQHTVLLAKNKQES